MFLKEARLTAAGCGVDEVGDIVRDGGVAAGVTAERMSLLHQVVEHVGSQLVEKARVGARRGPHAGAENGDLLGPVGKEVLLAAGKEVGQVAQGQARALHHEERRPGRYVFHQTLESLLAAKVK